MVPFSHGQWLAAHVPQAWVHLLAEEGHISLAFQRVGDVVANLQELVAAS
jgi:hypothetical protein